MRFSRIPVVCAVLLLSSIVAFAQSDPAALSEEYYKQGMEVFDFAHRKQAAELFILSVQANPKNAKANSEVGRSHSCSNQQVLDLLCRLARADPNVDPDIIC